MLPPGVGQPARSLKNLPFAGLLEASGANSEGLGLKDVPERVEELEHLSGSSWSRSSWLMVLLQGERCF